MKTNTLNRILDNRKGIFITATGTDIGKTYVSALMLKGLLDKGINAGYYKPALSGAYEKQGKLIPGDAEYVCNISGLNEFPENLVSYIFKTAVSPHLAANMEGYTIQEKVLLADYSRICKTYDFVIVEGCGGITCPLRISANETFILSDLIKLLDLDIVIVADAGLGTINSVLLTVAYARQCHINIVGIILNHYEPDNFLHQDNRKQIEFLTGLSVLDCILHI